MRSALNEVIGCDDSRKLETLSVIEDKNRSLTKRLEHFGLQRVAVEARRRVQLQTFCVRISDREGEAYLSALMGEKPRKGRGRKEVPRPVDLERQKRELKLEHERSRMRKLLPACGGDNGRNGEVSASSNKMAIWVACEAM
jgi:hypothetical protein